MVWRKKRGGLLPPPFLSERHLVGWLFLLVLCITTLIGVESYVQLSRSFAIFNLKAQPSLSICMLVDECDGIIFSNV
jgi:hypothetical protein